MSAVLIAHRGASAYAPENTLAAFKRARELGATEVELDIHLTRDGRLAVTHDPDLRRVARLDRKVSELTMAELSALDAGSWFGPAFQGEGVPSLEQVLDLHPSSVRVHVEVKEGGAAYPGIEKALLKLLTDRGDKARVIVSSFDHPTLETLRSLDASIDLAFLVDRENLPEMPAVWARAQAARARSMDASRRMVDAAFMAEAARRGLEVCVYTVNDLSEFKRVEGLGARAVFSDRPDLTSTAAGGPR